MRIELKLKKISEIVPATYNPRTISEAALNGLKASINEFGYVEPIVWNKRSGHIVGGHQRLKALQALGEKEVDVLTVDLSEKDERKLNVTLNNRAIQGEWDIPKLETILTELEDCPDFQELRLGSLKELCMDEISPEQSEKKSGRIPKEKDTEQKKITCPHCKKSFSVDVELQSKKKRGKK